MILFRDENEHLCRQKKFLFILKAIERILEKMEGHKKKRSKTKKEKGELPPDLYEKKTRVFVEPEGLSHVS